MSKTDTSGLSRRQLLRDATLTVGGAAMLAAAATQPAEAGPVSPTAVNYQATPKGDQRCDNCALFQPPSSCKFVSGAISPQGWCKLYVKKS